MTVKVKYKEINAQGINILLITFDKNTFLKIIIGLSLSEEIHYNKILTHFSSFLLWNSLNGF